MILAKNKRVRKIRREMVREAIMHELDVFDSTPSTKLLVAERIAIVSIRAVNLFERRMRTGGISVQQVND